VKKIGCCGFAGSRNRYYKNFELVELQQTFYQLPNPAIVEKWKKEAPEGFEFTLKAWQLITHPTSSPTYRRLKSFSIPEDKAKHYGFFRPTDEVFYAWQKTEEICQLLKTKFVIFQCPPSFTPIKEHKDNLIRFFNSINRKEYHFVFEPRGKWTYDEIKDLCDELNLIHCVDPFANLPSTKEVVYFRLHGCPPGKKMYNYQYSDEDLNNLHKIIQNYTQVYCLFNNISMYEDALRFKEMIKETKI
jgi:uncharacterized protein YecE (DUF72 family)